jgi:serpin B
LALSTSLYTRMTKSEKGNFVFSPFGVRSALALSAVGARGNTAAELAEGLRAKDGATAKWHKAFRSNQAQIVCPQGERSRRMEFANALFVQDGAEIKDSFSANMERHYAAAPYEADFQAGPTDARESIDEWVREQTRGKVSKIITPNSVNKDTKILLVSGLSVSDRWSYVFDPKSTRSEPFYLNRRDAKKADMMSQLETLPIVQNKQFQAIMLPTERERSSLVLILPVLVDGLKTVEMNLTPKVLADTVKSLRERTSQALVHVTLPKFKMAMRTNLTSALMDIGIQKPFMVGKANFTGIDGGDQKLFVGAALQKTVISVSEGGLDTKPEPGATKTKASAAPQRAATFAANHPFLFAALDNATGEILYMGRVTNPLF